MTPGNGSATRSEPVVRQVQVPDDVDMRALVGPRDEVLRTIERGFPRLQVHVRGSVVTLEGPAEEATLSCPLGKAGVEREGEEAWREVSASVARGMMIGSAPSSITTSPLPSAAGWST